VSERRDFKFGTQVGRSEFRSMDDKHITSLAKNSNVERKTVAQFSA